MRRSPGGKLKLNTNGPEPKNRMRKKSADQNMSADGQDSNFADKPRGKLSKSSITLFVHPKNRITNKKIGAKLPKI